MAEQLNMMPPAPQLMVSAPGVTRDGTRLARPTYLDARWCRFYQDRPRKIKGYREQVRDIAGVARNINVFNTDGVCIVHVGSTEELQRYAIQLNFGNVSTTTDRSPLEYMASPNNLWQSTNVFQTSGGTSYIFAAATPSLNDITDETEMNVYQGDVKALTPLTSMPKSSFTAIISDGAAGIGNVLDVSSVESGNGGIEVGDVVTGPGVAANTTIVALGTGTGGTGTYVVDTAQLVSPAVSMTSGLITTSGGLVGVGPYLFLYGHDGVVSWSVPAFPSDFYGNGAGDSRPTADKIVIGLPIRGTSAPAIILWSLASLIIGNFVGGDTLWNFSTVTTSGSILSANSVIEHNGIFYWATTSGFSQFAGVMQDVPNEFNKDWFLENLNLSQRQKVFAMKVPRWNEIWWCFPFGTSTECDWAVIFNYAKGYWYDTPLPGGGRGCGIYNNIFAYPIMSGVMVNDDTDGTSMWQHEFGLNEISGVPPRPLAIPSFFETHEFSLAVPNQPGANGRSQSYAWSILEPDFNQVGPLLFQVYSRANARAPVLSPPDTPFVIPADATSTTEQETDFKWTGRLTSFLIESNTLDGNYTSGSPLIHAKPSDKRRTG